MTTIQPIFQILLKKINFKQTPTSEREFVCNLLYNNRKIDNTEPFQVPTNHKSVDLSSLKSLIFNVKQDENKLPILVYIFYGEENAKKIILKRSDMMKKYDLEQKDQFEFEQNFGVFSISYQVNIRKQDTQKEESQKINESSSINPVKSISKNEQGLARNFKRPSMLQIGEKAERIRKSSVDHREIAQTLVNIQAQNSQQKLQKTNPKEQNNSYITPLTLVKDEKAEENLVKKDLKVNLFENFATIDKKSIQHHEKPQNKTERLHSSKPLEKADSDPHQASQNSHHQGHKSSQKSHDENGKHHDPYDSHKGHHSGHNSHWHHDDHEEHSEPISLKLKTVVVMLIIGLLFLMYDALDDRFSRKVKKIENVHVHKEYHGHGHDLHQTQPKKKKTGKKTKKISSH